MSGQKRPADPSSSLSSGAPPEKRREREGEDGGGPGVSAAAGGSTAVETVIKLGGVSNSEEQDIKALQAKNRKLGEALDQRQVIEDELRERIERLETRQATDDASLLILNRYWNQVNKDCSATPAFPPLVIKESKRDARSLSFSLMNETFDLTIRRYDQASSEPEKSQAGEGRSLKPETPEPDGDLQPGEERARTESRPLGRAANKADQRVSELQVLIEELQWDMEKIRRRENRLNAHLIEILERFEEMNSEMEENKELADNRLTELQKLQQDLQTVHQENNNMKSQFSVLYNESLILKGQLDETRARLNTTRTARLRQLEHMENDEVALQRKVRTEVFQLEDTLAQVRASKANAILQSQSSTEIDVKDETPLLRPQPSLENL
ncbi:E3 ubiquitin-protein ligase BRE1A [Nibea albiflora]|uniref:E3 ubiquitin-protein ligase BRE1A n=1 Tax=Nibea albiflora TaxID=240163 RepID=A0ACB7EQC7_NIBAL|nr:E3 ubiquitin-protein ligase BRE1A [Nibea albiflora]